MGFRHLACKPILLLLIPPFAGRSGFQIVLKFSVTYALDPISCYVRLPIPTIVPGSTPCAMSQERIREYVL